MKFSASNSQVSRAPLQVRTNQPYNPKVERVRSDCSGLLHRFFSKMLHMFPTQINEYLPTYCMTLLRRTGITVHLCHPSITHNDARVNLTFFHLGALVASDPPWCHVVD